MCLVQRGSSLICWFQRSISAPASDSRPSALGAFALTNSLKCRRLRERPRGSAAGYRSARVPGSQGAALRGAGASAPRARRPSAARTGRMWIRSPQSSGVTWSECFTRDQRARLALSPSDRCWSEIGRRRVPITSRASWQARSHRFCGSPRTRLSSVASLMPEPRSS